MNFIPILKTIENPYSVYIGNNGVGKSAILEALDVFFNDRDWNINIKGKKSQAFIAPILLIDKEKFDQKYPNSKQLAELISKYFWNIDKKANSNIANSDIIKFLNFRDSVKIKHSTTKYLFLLGIEHDKKEVYFSSFNDSIRTELKKDINTDLEKQLILFRKNILDYYSYIYIPVEQSINKLLKLETREMQDLIDKNILEEIEKVLNKKLENGGGKKESFVEYINKHLNQFTENVNYTISKIDSTYSYNHNKSSKRRLTAKDIREKILEAYFPLKNLKKGKKNLDQLSSGEQRKALIDIAYSFLTINGDIDRGKAVILAIDEPETSMHVSNCFDQFIRLEELAKNYSNQILLTTHWYGFMPITREGYMHHVEVTEDDKIQINSFDFSNYLEDRKRYPDVIELKSMYDLATSIITFMRNNPNINWIVCEGSDDKIYLEYLFKDEQQLMILPVNGCGNVIKLFQLLYTPVSEKFEIKNINGKILFLIDTDKEFKNVKKPFSFSQSVDDIIYLRRLQIKNYNIQLVNPFKNDTYEETEIEDCLEPDIYYTAIETVIKKSDDTRIINIFNHYKFNNEAKISRVKGDHSIIIPTDPSYYNKKQDIVDFLGKNQIKYKIAHTYIDLCKQRANINHKLYDTIKTII
jgi:ABC-type Mn2+/Zn2+ transport system ATPase subunit